MKQHGNIVWISALLLGWLFDFVFWGHAPGVSFAIYAALCLIGGFLLLRLDRARISPGALWLVPLIAIFAMVSFIRAEPLTMSLAMLFTLFLMALLAVTFAGGRWLEYGLADYAVGFFHLVVSIFTRPLAFRSEVRRLQDDRGASRSGANLWPVLRGMLIALPIVVVFAALLGSADVVFGDALNTLVKLLHLENLPQYIFRLIYILLAAYALLGVFLHAASQSKEERLISSERLSLLRFLGFVEAAIVLGSVIVLFGAFVGVQFRYFFGGQANISIEGYTYSEYARRGFGELLAVAFFSLLLILGLGAVTRRDDRIRTRLFSALCVLLVALVGVMLVSAYQRLSLYEIAYGFSRLRTYVHVALVWLGGLLAVVVLLEILRSERHFAAAALIIALGFGLTLSVLDVDAFIVRQNVARAVRGEKLDVAYLATLSTDSVPPLAEILNSSAYPAEIRDALGAALACRLQRSPVRQDSDWRSFTVSRWLARNALNEVGPQLGGYRVTDAAWPITILTPAGVTQNCVPTGN